VDFTFRLHLVGELVGGLLLYRLEDAPEVLTTWRELMAGAPDHCACFPQIFRSSLTGQSGVNVSVAYFGEVDDGRSGSTTTSRPAPSCQVTSSG
jgi:hypothetical protein